MFFFVYLALVEGEAGVNVFTVNSLQKGAAPVQCWLLLPRLEITEQLNVQLHNKTTGININNPVSHQTVIL